jgi:hypothetical protein
MSEFPAASMMKEYKPPKSNRVSQLADPVRVELTVDEII